LGGAWQNISNCRTAEKVESFGVMGPSLYNWGQDPRFGHFRKGILGLISHTTLLKYLCQMKYGKKCKLKKIFVV